MHIRSVLIVAVVVLAVGGCGGQSDGSQASSSANGYKQTELPFKLQDTATALAVNDKGDAAVVEIGYNQNPGRLLLLADGADAPTPSRVRIASEDLLIGQDDVVYYTTGEDEVKRLRRDADHAETLPFGIDAEEESIEAIASDRSGNVYALVYRSFVYRVLMLKPDATVAEELPFGELEDIRLMATTGEGDVMLFRSESPDRTIIELAHGATKPEVVTVPDQFDSDPSAIGLDGSLYFLSSGEKPGEGPQITVVDKNFTITDRVSFSATRNGSHELAVGADRSIYVTDDNRVFRLEKE